MIDVINSTIEDVRSLSTWLNKSGDYEDYPSDVEGMIKRLSEVFDLKLSYHFHADSARISSSLKQNIHYILEELLLNTHKYSYANNVAITISDEEEHLYVEYKENGKGYLENLVSEGNGTRSIHNRIQLFGGEMQTILPSTQTENMFVRVITFPI